MPSINRMRKEIRGLKSKAGTNLNAPPTIENFLEYCRPFYNGRFVGIQEIWFPCYNAGARNRVKSNPALFCRLSEKYFEEIHNVPNPLKSNNHSPVSLKSRVCSDYMDEHDIPYTEREEVILSDEFNEYFNDWWDKFKMMDDYWSDDDCTNLKQVKE